jgi:hypothetical protein
MNHVCLSLTNRKFSVHLYALNSPHTALRTFTPLRDQFVICGHLCLTTDSTGVRSPAETKDFFSDLCVQTSSEAHPASCPVGTGVLSPGVKLTTHLIWCRGQEWVGAVLSPLARFGVAGRLYLLFANIADCSGCAVWGAYRLGSFECGGRGFDSFLRHEWMDVPVCCS